MTGAFRFTTGRWFNKPTEDGLSFAKAPAYHSGFTYEGFEYGKDYPQEFDPGQPVQQSLLCSPSTQLLAIDVDRPEELPGSATGELVSWSDAASTRGSHFHVLVDMRGVAAEDWPVQGVTAWGDVKAAGFVPVPGSVHYTGARYEEAVAWQDKVVKATPELAAALRRDREDHALRRLAAARERMGLGGGTRLPDGSYLYSSGYAGGTWNDLPDGYLQHDDLLKDLVWDMHVTYGRPEEEVRETWDRLAGALTSAWTDRDWARHWKRVPARRAEVLENDDTYRLMEDFGLKLLPTPLVQDYTRQREEYEAQVSADTSGPRPPEPPPGWGFEHEGIDYFSLWLGDGVFDARKPNDAENGLAVLLRAHNVLRYDEEAGTWLLRGTGKWTSFTGSAGPRAVINGLLGLMPEGCMDPVKLMDLDEDTHRSEIAALKQQAKNKERFSASSQIGSVAAVMADIVLRHRGAGSVARSSALDCEPDILWAGGVAWDLRSSGREPVLAAVDRNVPHLMTAPVVPDMSVETPLFDAYCRAVFPDLPEEWGDKPDAGREWALDVLAACFTGYADALMPVLLGETRLGKTFLVNLLTSVLGDYGGVMAGDLLKADARLHGSFTLKLKGMRLAFVDEAPGKGKASQEHLKKITGGGKMEGNKMRENPVEFTPTHTLVLATNAAPELTDPALRARARMIRFEGDRDAVRAAATALGRSVSSRQWKGEMPGVLARMMARAAAWLADRSIADADRAPRTWQSWTDDIVAEQDSLTGWLHCGEVAYESHPGTTADKLHQHYAAWCTSHKMPVELDRIQFGIKLKAEGYSSRKSMGVKWWPLKIVMPGAAEFMGGSSQPGRALSLPAPTVPATVHPQNPSSSTVESVFREGRDSTPPTNTHNAHAHTHAHTQEAQRENHPPSPSNPPCALLDLGKRAGMGGPLPALPAETDGDGAVERLRREFGVDGDVLPLLPPGAQRGPGRPKGSTGVKDAAVSCLACGTGMPRTTTVPVCTRDTCKDSRREWIKARVFEAYGGPVCACCGEERFERLSLDHVNGDGHLEGRKLKGGGAGAKYGELFSTGFPDRDRYQVLCHSCNMEKGTKAACPCGGRSNKTVFPEIAKKLVNSEKAITPPSEKAPSPVRKGRLSDEEKQARADARKAKLAGERAAAKTAKIAEIGGRLVQLPAIVLRDQTIMEVSADTCRAWLEPSLGELAVDVENSAFPAGHAAYALRLVQVGTEGFAAVFDPSDAEQAGVIRWALENAGILHAHSAHADLVPLERAGLGDRSMWGKMLDTVHIAKLLDPSLTDSDEAALKPLGKNVLGESYALSWRCDEVRKKLFTAGGWLTEVELDTPLEKSGWLQVPFCEAFVRYAASDVMDCAAVWRVLSERNASAY